MQHYHDFEDYEEWHIIMAGMKVTTNHIYIFFNGDINKDVWNSSTRYNGLQVKYNKVADTANST